MNYDSLMFLSVTLPILSLVVVASLWILDLTKANVKQKLLILKIGFVLLGLMPFVFIFIKSFFANSIAITFTSDFIGQNMILNKSSQVVKFSQNWFFYLLLIYLSSVAILLCRILFSYIAAYKQLRNSSQNIIQGQLVFQNSNVTHPLCFGLFKAKIYLPNDAVLRWTAREIQICIAHEKHHLEQYDPLWKLLSHIVQSFLFFVPWMYYLTRRFELEMEISCDASVRAATNISVLEYGNLLLAMANDRSKNYVFNNMTDSILKKRIIAMKKLTKNKLILASALTVLLFLTGSTAIVMANGVTTKSHFFRIVSKILIDGKVVSNPIILAKENQMAFIVITNTNSNRAEGLKMNLIAKNITSSSSNNAIEIKYDIEYKNGNDEMRANPHVVLEDQHEENIQLSSTAQHTYEMRVLAERVDEMRSK